MRIRWRLKQRWFGPGMGRSGKRERRWGSGCEWVAGRGGLAESTRVSYTEHINVYIIPALGSIPLAELTIKDLNDFYLALARRRTRLRGSTLSAGTVTRVHATLRAGLNAALRRGLIEWTPAREAEPPRRHRPRAVVWTEDLIAHWKDTGERPSVAVWTATQTAVFLAAIAGDRLYAAYHLIALRGLRRVEAAGLRWCDLDLERGLCFITHQVQRRGGGCPPGPRRGPPRRGGRGAGRRAGEGLGARPRLEACDAARSRAAGSSQTRQARASRVSAASAVGAVHAGEDLGPVQDRIRGGGEGGRSLSQPVGTTGKLLARGAIQACPVV